MPSCYHLPLGDLLEDRFFSGDTEDLQGFVEGGQGHFIVRLNNGKYDKLGSPYDGGSCPGRATAVLLSLSHVFIVSSSDPPLSPILVCLCEALLWIPPLDFQLVSYSGEGRMASWLANNHAG